MTEHFTRNTESATKWCKKCGRLTEHRVDNGRAGPCIDPKHPPSPKSTSAGLPAKGPATKGKSATAGKQKNLFGEDS